MSIDREPTSARSPRRHPLVAAVRSILLVSLPPNGIRLIDILLLVVGIPVALIICLPIIGLTILVGIPISLLLQELEVPDSISGIYGLGVFGLGLVLSFIVLVKLSRRVPRRIRAFFSDDDAREPGPAPVLGQDPNADDRNLDARLAMADAALAPGAATVEAIDPTPTSDRTGH